jgi:hypothetical protein
MDPDGSDRIEGDSEYQGPEVEVDEEDTIDEEQNTRHEQSRKRRSGGIIGGPVWQWFQKTRAPPNAKKNRDSYHKCNYCGWMTCHPTRAIQHLLRVVCKFPGADTQPCGRLYILITSQDKIHMYRILQAKYYGAKTTEDGNYIPIKGNNPTYRVDDKFFFKEVKERIFVQLWKLDYHRNVRYLLHGTLVCGKSLI